jgi:hypothetical protein
MEGGTNRGTVSTWIVPLVRPEVQVEDDRCLRLFGKARSIQGGAPARFFAQVGAGELKHAALSDGRRQHIVDVQSDIRTIIPVKDKGKLIRRLNAQDDKAGVPTWLPGAEANVHSFFRQKMNNEVSDRIVTESGQ